MHSDRRMFKTVRMGDAASTTETYLWDLEREVGRMDAEGRLLEFRALGGGLGNEVGAAIAIELREHASDTFRTYVPVHDHRGNVSTLFDGDTGLVGETYRYSAFGEAVVYSDDGGVLEDGGIGNPWRFSSKRFDPEAGLLYVGRRYYDPQIGRFLTLDPAGFADGPNRYVYARNNPLGFVDPDGLLAKGAIGGDFIDPGQPGAVGGSGPWLTQSGWRRAGCGGPGGGVCWSALTG